jgi:hypothetical protein
MVVGSTFDEHLKNLKEIFGRPSSAHLQLNPKKCQLFQQEVKFLGYAGSSAGIQMNRDKLEAVREWLLPKDKQKISWASVSTIAGLSRGLPTSLNLYTS